MLDKPSRAEALVMHVLHDWETLPLEQMTEHLPELSWSELFHAVDRLSRRGEVVLRRRGFAYHLSLPSLNGVSA